MPVSHPELIQLRAAQSGRAEHIALAGIWRRGWVAAQGHRVERVAPIEHWLARVEAEFVAPAEVLIAERGSQALAFMVMLPARAYVAQLFVEPHLHRSGLGRRLLDAASRRMPTGWRLHVATANAQAQQFYDALGLLRGEIDRHPASGRERVSYRWVPPA